VATCRGTTCSLTLREHGSAVCESGAQCSIVCQDECSATCTADSQCTLSCRGFDAPIVVTGTFGCGS
jgi:hypothetical protein